MDIATDKQIKDWKNQQLNPSDNTNLRGKRILLCEDHPLMPIMDGIEATKQIRCLSKKEAKEIPIIAMTANAFAEDMERTSEEGMNAHLSKTIEKEKLFHTLFER